MQCPKCRSSLVRRSHRRRPERLLSFVLPILPHRCRACRHRFLRLAGPVLTPFRGTVLVLIVLALAFGLSRFAEAVLHGSDEPAEEALMAEVGGVSAELSPAPVPRSLSLPPVEEAPLPEKAQGVEGRGGRAEPVADPGSGAVPPPGEEIGKGEEGAEEDLGGRGSRSEAGQKAAASRDPQPEEGEIRVEALRAVEVGEALEIRLVSSRRPGEFQRLVLDDPRRFVVDLPGSWSSQLPADLSLSHSLAAGVRLGLRAEGLRIVVDLRGETGRDPRVQVTANGLTIRLEPGSLRPLPP